MTKIQILLISRNFFSAHLDPKAKNYNGNSVQIELKQVKNLHQKILNAKYQKAVLEVKLANLQIVAQKQKDFLKQVKQFKTVKDEQELLLDNLLQQFHEKISCVKPILEIFENNIPAQDLNSFKRKFDQHQWVLSKKMKIE